MEELDPSDPLDYVRLQLDGLKPQQMMLAAANAGVSLRTAQNITERVRDPRYSSVKRLYVVLKKNPIKVI